MIYEHFGLKCKVSRTLKNIGIMLNFENDLFEKCYYILGHIIITIRFRNDMYYLEILKLDLFAKFYDMFGYNIIIESFGLKCNFCEQ